MPKTPKKASMQMIADRLGISKGAVSIALAGKTGVSDDLRDSVVRTARELGYRWKRNAVKGVDPARNILVLIPQYISADTFFYNEIYWSIEREAKVRGCLAMLTSVDAELEERLALPSVCKSMPFGGVIVIGVFSEAYVRMLCGLGLPVLSVDHVYAGVPVDSVVTANLEGACDVVSHLLTLGHRDIGYIGSVDVTASLFERWCGYVKALRTHGLVPDPRHSILQTAALGDLLGDAEELGALLDALPDHPTAWFCGGDRIALALTVALKNRGLRIPEDVSVAGFDDTQAAGLVTPPLTTYRVHRDRLGVLAVDTLLARMDGGQDVLKQAIYGELVVRGSVCAPGSASAGTSLA